MLSLIFFLHFLRICSVGGTLRRIIGGGDAIPDAPFVLVTAKCKMGGEKVQLSEKEDARGKQTGKGGDT